MIGFLFVATVAIWFGVSVWIALQVGKLVSKPALRVPTRAGIFLLMILAPFVDEVIGKHQFERLCEVNGIQSAELSKVRGKRVKIAYGERLPVAGTILPVKQSEVKFTDSASGEVVIHYKNYYTAGGWLMRYTWLSTGAKGAMLFDGNGCGLAREDRLIKAANVSIVN